MIAAAVISMSTVLGKPSPFAASFAAAMSGIDCISAFVGSVAGYILGGNYTDGVTVTSALLSVVAIRMIVSRRKSAVSEIVSAVTAAGSVFAAISHIIYRKRGDELHHSFGHGRRGCGCCFTLVTACRKA